MSVEFQTFTQSIIFSVGKMLKLYGSIIHSIPMLAECWYSNTHQVIRFERWPTLKSYN